MSDPDNEPQEYADEIIRNQKAEIERLADALARARIVAFHRQESIDRLTDFSNTYATALERLTAELKGVWHDHGVMVKQYDYWMREAKRLETRVAELEAVSHHYKMHHRDDWKSAVSALKDTEEVET